MAARRVVNVPTVAARHIFVQMFESFGMLYPTAAVERLAVDMRIGTVKGGG